MSSEQLFDAAKRGDAAVALAALDGCASVEAREEHTGWTALHCAAYGGHSEVVRLLLDHGAAVNSMANGNSGTPLHWAAGAGHVDCARLLLERGADVNAASCAGETPLHYAAREGITACAELLLQHNAAVDAQDVHDRTPLVMAAMSGHAQCVRLLLQRGALNVVNRDRSGWTPLHSAAVAARGARATVFELLWRGADAAATCRSGETPAYVAARNEKHDIANLLAAWQRGELRVWSRAVHAMFPAAFRADVRAVLLAIGVASVRAPAGVRTLALAGENPLRLLRDHHLLDEVFKALLIVHMGGPAAPAVVHPSAT